MGGIFSFFDCIFLIYNVLNCDFGTIFVAFLFSLGLGVVFTSLVFDFVIFAVNFTILIVLFSTIYNFIFFSSLWDKFFSSAVVGMCSSRPIPLPTSAAVPQFFDNFFSVFSLIFSELHFFQFLAG